MRAAFLWAGCGGRVHRSCAVASRVVGNAAWGVMEHASTAFVGGSVAV